MKKPTPDNIDAAYARFADDIDYINRVLGIGYATGRGDRDLIRRLMDEDDAGDALGARERDDRFEME